ncbi:MULTISPECIES: hypothetical protein [unclassified Brevundimonas]|uniref:hypothetical protein n=1 Tax=unclassified Brevundimonas TaxID=2622653 RepID=UPI0025BB99AF|nr:MULTISPECIES: hypothetical protein [unclassified Brevundimonas]
MAEVLVMPVASPKLWIVVPLCEGRTEWCKAIALEAAAQGLAVAGSASDGFGASDDGADIVICDQVTDARASGATNERIVVLMGRPSLSDGETRRTVSEVSSAYWEAVKFDDVRKVIPPIKGGQLVEFTPDFKVSAPALEENDDATSTALQQAVVILEGADNAEWKPVLFNFDVRAMDDAKAGRPFDITGRPRFLISGPYIPMPAGSWRAKITIGFDEGASRSRYRVDWGGVDDYRSIEFAPSQPGYFDLIMDHEWIDASPCEMRLVLLEGLFDGMATFGGVDVVRLT